MELKFFKDKLFDEQNESDSLNISGIEVNDLSNIFTVETNDGSVLEIECREIG